MLERNDQIVVPKPESDCWFGPREQSRENIGESDDADRCSFVCDYGEVISALPHRGECEVDGCIGRKGERRSHDVLGVGVVGLEQGVANVHDPERNTVVANEDS